MYELNGIRDVRRIEKALRDNWKIPAAAFDVLPGELIKIACNPKMKGRTRIAAIRALEVMHAQNQANDPVAHELNVSLSLGAQVVADFRREIKDDPIYIEYLRQQPTDGESPADIDGARSKAQFDSDRQGDSQPGLDGQIAHPE